MRRVVTTAVLLTLPGFLVLWPVLMNGYVFADGDAVLQLYPAFHFVADALQRGESVIWNPHVLSGFPTAASLMGGMLSGLHQMAIRWLGPVLAYAWLTWLYYSLAAVFIFLLARRVGLKHPGALFAGMVAPWIFANAAWAANLTMTPSFFLLPAFLYGSYQFASSSRWRWVVAVGLGLLVGTALHAAHLQMATYAATVAFVWAAVLDLKHRRLMSLPFTLLTMLIAGTVAWPQLELSSSARQYSARLTEGVSWAEVQAGALHPGDALGLLLPGLSLPGVTVNPGLLFVGAMPLLLLVLSWRRRGEFAYRSFLVLLVVATLAAVKYSPLLWVLQRLPVYSSFRAPSRLMHVALLAVIMLAAYGLDELTAAADGVADRRWQRWSRITVVAVSAMVLWSLMFPVLQPKLNDAAMAYLDRQRPFSQRPFPELHYRQAVGRILDGVSQATTLPHRAAVVPALSFLGAAGLLAYRRRLPSAWITPVAVTIAVAPLVAIASTRLPVVPRAVLLDPPLSVKYLERGGVADARVFPVFAGLTMFERLDTPYGYHPVDNVELLKNLLSPNLHMLVGLSSLDTYDNLMDRRHSRVLAALGSDRSVEQTGKLSALKLPLSEKLTILLDRLPLLSTYHVRHLISAYPLQHPQLRELVRWTATRHRIPLYLYENLSVRPPYYLTGQAVFSAREDEDELWEQLMAAAEAGETLVECVRCPELEPGTGAVTVLAQGNGWYRFHTRSSSPQLLVTGVNLLPGWVAQVDGVSAPIVRANFAHIAVAVPAGEHVVSLRFRP